MVGRSSRNYISNGTDSLMIECLPSIQYMRMRCNSHSNHTKRLAIYLLNLGVRQMEHGGCLFEPDMLPVALMGELSIGAPTRILIEFNEN